MMKRPSSLLRRWRPRAAIAADTGPSGAELGARQVEDEAIWAQDRAEWAARDAEHASLGEKRVACTGCDCDLYVKNDADCPYYCGKPWCAPGYIPKFICVSQL